MSEFLSHPSYYSLGEDDAHGEAAEADIIACGAVVTKFCVFGLITSKSWDLTYLVVSPGRIRLYDSEDTYLSNPANFAFSEKLTRRHTVSKIYSKDYSSEYDRAFVVHYFYLEINNGVWAPTRIIKIGSSDRRVVADVFYPAIKNAI